MRRFALSCLAVLGVAAALAVTASSTSQQATAAGMKGVAVIGLVVLLEVVNVAGTWTWLTDTRVHVRWEAAGGVAVASVVTGACGLLVYGLIGLVAPAGLLFAVHLTFRLNQPAVLEDTRLVIDDSDEDGRLVIEDSDEDAAPSRLVIEDSGEDTRPVIDDSDEDSDEDTGPIPINASVIEDEDVVSRLASWDGPLPGVGVIARELGIGKTKAGRCKAEAQRRRGDAAS